MEHKEDTDAGAVAVIEATVSIIKNILAAGVPIKEKPLVKPATERDLKVITGGNSHAKGS